MADSILIIEDEATFREALRHFLQDAGFAVCEAAQAHQALELFELGPADLVLLDLGIPGGDGLELLSAM